MNATTLNDEQIQEFKDSFAQFDLEGAGRIATHEMGTFFKALGQEHTDEEIEKMKLEVDADGDGTVDFPEILSMMARMMKDDDTEAKVMEAFKVFDRNGTGGIDIEDLRRVMTNLGDKLTPDEMDQMIREADLDENGVIDNEEFIRMMMAN